MNRSPLRELDYLLAWFLFTVCLLGGSFFAGAILGGVIGFVLAAAGQPIHVIARYAGIAGYFISLPISYLCFRIFVGQFIVRKVLTAFGNQTLAYSQDPVYPRGRPLE